jgi:nucleotide-binding universal stress UspA family protein
MAYTSIVVGTDGSPTAERAVRQAAELAAIDSARVVIVRR